MTTTCNAPLTAITPRHHIALKHEHILAWTCTLPQQQPPSIPITFTIVVSKSTDFVHHVKISLF
ncbi:hypothetical protein QP775_17540 [Paenibacillus sp. UMB4589-SE434]|nr:hypothetical protein [Paenibacillus sp. UMB4589-SE434]